MLQTASQVSVRTLGTPNIFNHASVRAVSIDNNVWQMNVESDQIEGSACEMRRWTNEEIKASEHHSVSCNSEGEHISCSKSELTNYARDEDAKKSKKYQLRVSYKDSVPVSKRLCTSVSYKNMIPITQTLG